MKSKIYIFLLIITAFAFQNCQKEPSACFGISADTLNVGDTLHFSYCSINDNSCLWDFGDGTTSTIERPIKKYDSAGVFKIVLTVFTQNGKKTDTLSKRIVIKPSSIPPPVAPAIKITVKDLISLNLIGNITIKLYLNFSDWQNHSNPVATGMANNTGTITFTNLSKAMYYVRAENANYTNYDLGMANVVYVLTDTLIENYTYPFTAWVQEKPTPPTALRVEVRTSAAPQTPVSGINVILFTSYSDWQNMTNPVTSGFTNSSGVILFNSDLNPVQYFVRAQNSTYSNYQAGMQNQNNIITNTLLADTINNYIAYVDLLQTTPTSLQVTVNTAFPPQNLVPNILVTLFATYTDWQNKTNPVINGFTDASGKITFYSNLNPVQYYVLVESPQLNNIQAGLANPSNVMTSVLVANTMNYYNALVDNNTTPPTALQITVRTQGGMQQPVANINVKLFANYNDWLTLANPIMSGITNQSGVVVFTSNLNAVQYYVRAENAQFTNLSIGQMNQNNVLTPTIILNQQNFYTAFVRPVVK